MTKRKVGRPREYETPEEMQPVVDKYFDQCTQEDIKPTITGLALWLGFDSRQSLLDYADRPEFSVTIKKAKSRVEQVLESHLYSGQVAGVIFNLKNNFGWKDKSETEITGKDGGPVLLWGAKSQ